MRRLLVPVLFLLVLTGPAWADGRLAKDGPAAAELVCAHEALPPGASVALAIVLHLDEGWHAYWINPGDAGQPPEVAWTLPAGYEVGPLAWPAPHRLVEGPITTFVHEDELVLRVMLTVPEDAPEGEATIGATVTWLACKDRCLPGRAELSLTRPVRDGTPETSRAAHERIEAARAQLPVPVDATVELEAGRLTLAVGGLEGVPADLFPEAEGVFDLAALEGAWSQRADGVHTATLTLLDASLAPERFAAVVTTAEPEKAYVLDVPVVRAAAAAEPGSEGVGVFLSVPLAATVIGLVLLFLVATAVLRSGRRNQT